MSTKPDITYEIYDELAAVTVASLVEDSGLQPEAAKLAAARFVERLRRSPLAGVKHYFPRGKLVDVDRVRREVARRWDGTNTRELCTEFDITESWLRELHEQSQGRGRASR